MQPAQPDLDFVWCSTPDMPKVDGLRSTSAAPQDGQTTTAVRENISFSKSFPHRLQRNSKIGISLAPTWMIAQRALNVER